MRNQSKRELITPEVTAEPVVRDVYFHGNPLRNRAVVLQEGVSGKKTGKHPRDISISGLDNAAPLSRSWHVAIEKKAKGDLSTPVPAPMEGQGLARTRL
jgi:hypothetical protein